MPVCSAHRLCHDVPPSSCSPSTACPSASAVTFVSVPPATSTVIPADGLTFVERFAGSIVSRASLAVGLVIATPVGDEGWSPSVED